MGGGASKGKAGGAAKGGKVYKVDESKSHAYNACAQAHETMTTDVVPALTNLTEYYSTKDAKYHRSADKNPELAEMTAKLESATLKFDRRMKHVLKGRETLGLLNPQAYMTKYLQELSHRYNIIVLNPDETDSSLPTIKALAKQAKDAGCSCVVGLAQKDSWQHALINREMGAVSISSLAYLVAMNKYMQRTIEKKTFFFKPCTPETESNDEIFAKIPSEEWPCMLKNTSLSLGRGVFRCKTPEAMAKILDEYRGDKSLQAAIKKTNDDILDHFTDDDKSKLDCDVPPFIIEHCVNLELGWVEYCYEGCITDDGQLVHYGFTEEMYSTEHAGLAYITPPMSYPRSKIPELEVYVSDYMDGLIQKGYLKQFFNLEIWGLIGADDSVEFCFCEINPRCAHAYHIPYKIAYGTNLWADNFDLVMHNTKPQYSPWSKWVSGDCSVSLQALINVMGSEGKKVNEILDYRVVDHLERKGKVELVRHTKQRDYTITADDAASGAGCTLLQIFCRVTSHDEAAAHEVAVRDVVYTIKQDDSQPDWWLKRAEKGNPEMVKKKLMEGCDLTSVTAEAYNAQVRAKTRKD